MEEPAQTQLLKTLGDLGEKELKYFKWYLQKPQLLGGLPVIPKTDLQTADNTETVNLMISKYKFEDALEVTKKILEKVKTQTSKFSQVVVKQGKEEALTKCQHELKAKLNKRFLHLLEGIAEEEDPTLLNQIYTELWITEGQTTEVNEEHEAKVKKAKLSSCNLTERSCKALSSVLSFQLSSLRHLDLSNNDLKDAGVKALFAELANPPCKLETLSLSGCLMTDEGCDFLASFLTSHPTHLRELDLSYNYIGDSGEKLLNQLRLESMRVEPAGVRWLRP
uniref:NACHT, LRR and PYD domains-containing protein 9A n=1 Tax=Maylandia zebra TaxID=106582 RepID=UPI000D2FB774